MGSDTSQQLLTILGTLGTPDFLEYLAKHQINVHPSLTDQNQNIPTHPKIPFSSLVNNSNRHLATPLALDLLSQMLLYDHTARITASQALLHPFFHGKEE